MSTGANVHSSEAIESVRNSLARFADQVQDALDELAGEMRRALEWLEHDRPRFWKNQIRIAHDQVHEAQQALHRCLMFPIAGERPSCYEERAALKKAQARLAYCEEKSERVRHWQRTLQHELFEYEGRISQLVRTVEIDVPQAMAVLHNIVRRLEEYQSIRAKDPRVAYDDLSLARELWPVESSSTASSAGADAGNEGEEASDDHVTSAEESIGSREIRE
jgi:hypothetical protein